MKKAYIAIKYYPDHQNRLDIEQISKALEQNGVDTICVARDLEKWGQVKFTPTELMHRSFMAIESSDVVVVDLTVKGVGLGIEAGYAWAKSIPIITIARKGSNISETLQGISHKIFWYGDFEELNNFFTQVV